MVKYTANVFRMNFIALLIVEHVYNAWNHYNILILHPYCTGLTVILKLLIVL